MERSLTIEKLTEMKHHMAERGQWKMVLRLDTAIRLRTGKHKIPAKSWIY